MFYFYQVIESISYLEHKKRTPSLDLPNHEILSIMSDCPSIQLYIIVIFIYNYNFLKVNSYLKMKVHGCLQLPSLCS